MKEMPLPHNLEEEKKESAYEKHGRFFSDRAKKIMGNTLLVSGSVLVLAGIYELMTGQKVSDITAAYADKLPDIVNQLVDKLSTDPIYAKTGGGASMIYTGENLKGSGNN